MPWLAAGLTADDVAAWQAEDLDRARTWRDAGFGAREARDLVRADATLTPAEARVWRAEHRSIEEARAQRAAGGDALPSGLELGWAATGSEREDVDYGVTDPPGTRGSAAQSTPPPYDLP